MVLGLAGAVLDSSAINGRMLLILFGAADHHSVASHAIGRAAYLMRETMEHPGAIDDLAV